MDLVETADVLIHSMRASAANRLGIGYAAVSARNPRTIYGLGCGYHQNGPKPNLPAYADAHLRETGFWMRYEHPTEAACITTAMVTHFSASPGSLHQPPRLGEHSGEILVELEARRRAEAGRSVRQAVP